MRTGASRRTVGGMGYPPREQHPGVYYHVGTRGNNQRDIYTDPGSRWLFELRLGAVVQRHGWTLIAFVQMTNHYHLVLKLGEGGMSNGMKELNGGYAMAFNARHGRRDHLFGRRYWSRQLEDEEDLATTGIVAAARFHTPNELWRIFGDQPRRAMPAWASYVEAGLVSPRPVSDTGVSRSGALPT
jgi:REP element-mobilizing transposase RayT